MANHNLNVGFEIETLLILRNSQAQGLSLEKFAKMATKFYNTKIDRNRYLPMHPDIDGDWDGEEYRDWSLTDDATIAGGTSTICRSIHH